MAANTGFADFPRLASFQAGDSFLPRQLTKRGHRLVYSNGIIALAAAAGFLVIVTGAEVTRLIPLYAIGVFTGFTLSQSGMTKHHIRKREPGWRKGVLINGFGAILSGLVAIIIAVTKFAEGAWAILIVLPLLVIAFLRLNRQYVREAKHLEADVPAAATAPILRRHVVLVFVDQLDLASARAIQYARTLTPDELRAVHFVVDDDAARHLAEEWSRLGLQWVPLELVECPDRRLTRTAVTTVARELSDGDTEVSVLLPDRKFPGLWHRILHDRTAGSIQEEVSRLPHANVTSVPFHFDTIDDARVPLSAIVAAGGPAHVVPGPRESGGGEASFATTPAARSNGEGEAPAPGCLRIADVRYRDRVRVSGRVRSLRVVPQHAAPVLELVLDDGTAALSVVFLGRRRLAGVDVGTRMVVEGTVGLHRHRLAMLNPAYELRP
jgi:Amino acid permease